MHTLDKRNNLKLIKYTLTSKNRKINPNKQIKEILRQEQSQWNKNRKTIEKNRWNKELVLQKDQEMINF